MKKCFALPKISSTVGSPVASGVGSTVGSTAHIKWKLLKNYFLKKWKLFELQSKPVPSPIFVLNVYILSLIAGIMSSLLGNNSDAM